MVLSFFLRFILLLTLLTLFLGGIRGGQYFYNYLSLRDSHNILKVTTFRIEAVIKNLENEIEKIQSSSSYARKILRDKFQVTDKNENILFFAD